MRWPRPRRCTLFRRHRDRNGDGEPGAAEAGEVEIRPIRADEWQELRELRLEALKQDADAFGSTLAQEEADPDVEWQRWAERSSRADREVTFVAVDGGRFVGMTMGFRPKDEPEVVLLFAMWVDPSIRRQSVGIRLAEAVADWARAGGARRLRVRVTEDNGPAVNLYGRTGFLPTSRREQLRPGSDRMTFTMERILPR